MIYVIPLVLLVTLALLFDIGGYGKGRDFWYNFVFIFLVTISGFRYKVGGDTLAYMKFFEDVPFLDGISEVNFALSRFEPFWLLTISFFKSIIDDFIFFQFVHAVFVNGVLFLFIRKNTSNIFSSILIYYVFFYLYFNMEIIRESIAICLLIIGYPFLAEKKWLQYYLCCTAAFLFHSSAIILFFLPLFSGSKITFSFWLFAGCFFVVFNLILNLLPSIIHSILLSDRLVNKFDSYSSVYLSINGMIQLFVYYIFVPGCILFLFKKLNKRYSKFSDLYAYYFLVCLVVVSLGISRFINFFVPFMIIFFADFLIHIVKKRSFHNFSFAISILIFLCLLVPKWNYYSRDTSYLAINTVKFNLYYPYSSILSKEEYLFRESIFYGGFEYHGVDASSR